MGEIIKAPFKYRMDLDSMEPLTPEDEELIKFISEKPSEDENILQRNYRLNRIEEFDKLADSLFGSIEPLIKK